MFCVFTSALNEKCVSVFVCVGSHGDKKVFSCQGLRLAVDWFWDKGLRDITVFIPLWRKEARADALITGEVSEVSVVTRPTDQLTD